MTRQIHTLHIAQLKNNCPTCFGADGLKLTFKQEEKESSFFVKPSTQLEESLYCQNCDTTIYPVNWDIDIERVYEYNKKIAETKRRSLKVKPLFYIMIFGGAVLLAAGIYYLATSLML